MNFLNLHTLSYGSDRKLTFIKDKYINIMFNEILNLGFEHVTNNVQVLSEEVKLTLKPGFAIVDDISFVLMEPFINLQKSRERIFELLCVFRIQFEHLGRFSLEYSSIDDLSFYLIYQGEVTYKLVEAFIDQEAKINTIRINQDAFKYLLDTYLIDTLRKERVGLIVFDDNKSPVLKIKKFIKDNMTTYESKETTIDLKKEDMKKELIPYCLIVTLSLAKKNQVKLVSFVENFERNVEIEKLGNLLDLYDKKIVKNVFNLTLSSHISKDINKKCFCLKCAKEYSKKGFIVKDFAQKLNLKTCENCMSNKNIFTYTLL